MKRMRSILCVLLAVFVLLGSVGCTTLSETEQNNSSLSSTVNGTESSTQTQGSSTGSDADSDIISPSILDLDDIPVYSGSPYVELNGNEPEFSKSELKAASFERYSPMDSLNRCGVAYACIGRDIMPTEERGSIGMVKPSGWQTVKYDIVDGKYLYNRCHLIGFQLSGENANERNLITGTRYMNVQGMLPFENIIADYVEETGNHVLYRVTPVFEDDNLVASGVQMEAKSVEDDGESVCFNVYVYNVQPGVTIDYATGQSSLTDQPAEEETNSKVELSVSYIYNKNTKKFHRVGCYSVKQMKESNKGYFEGERSELIERGYSPCKNCNP